MAGAVPRSERAEQTAEGAEQGAEGLDPDT